jgi:kynurenine formamidase
LNWQGRDVQVNFSAGTSIAITAQPNGPQPAFFSAAPMSAHALQLGDFNGNVSQGGSCNVQELYWAPHCHGTHTECVGHILAEPVHVLETIDTRPCLARLISLECPADSGEIGLDSLRAALPNGVEIFSALIIRTLPNLAAKQSRNYDLEPGYPVFSIEATAWLAASNLQHLLLDTPSLDSASNASLSNHRTWWCLDDDSKAARRRSVTEMIYVPDELADGDYWLHLELAPLQSDAVPSRPVIYPIR